MLDMKRFTSKNQKTGEYGETICLQFLRTMGHEIFERNYTEKEGEVDIISKKDNTLHFIEVKSVSCENTENISHETTYNPAENVTREKIRKLQKTIYKYLEQNNVSRETKYQLDVYLVYIDARNTSHKVKRIENVF